MTEIEIKDLLRREQELLDRLENVKRLIQMQYTLLTVDPAPMFRGYNATTYDGEAIGKGLYRELYEIIMLQILSIYAIEYGYYPDVGEVNPMLEWHDAEDANEDTFTDVFQKVLKWNG